MRGPALFNKNKTMVIPSSEIVGFAIKKYGTRFRLMGRLTCDFKRTISFGVFDTLPEAQEFMIALGRQIDAG
jgi:hypothetical protein